MGGGQLTIPGIDIQPVFGIQPERLRLSDGRWCTADQLSRERTRTAAETKVAEMRRKHSVVNMLHMMAAENIELREKLKKYEK